MTGNTFNAAAYNTVPNAPGSAWNARDFGAPNLMDYMQAFNPPIGGPQPLPAYTPPGRIDYSQPVAPRATIPTTPTRPTALSAPQPLTPQEQAYLATLDPFAAQAFLQNRGLA